MPSTGGQAKGFASLAYSDTQGDFSVVEAIGGIRGVVESMLPGVLFVVLFLISHDLRVTLISSAALAVLLMLVRLLQRQPMLGALSGLVSVGICLIWAWRTGQARDYYTFGLITNAAYLLVLGISLAVRVPALGFMIEFIRKLPMSHYRRWLHEWLDDAALHSAYTKVTLLWMAVFALRLVVQVPLYVGNNIAWLGTMRLVMGIPCWALAIWVSYLIIATPLHAHVQAERVGAVSAENDRGIEDPDDD